MGSQEKYNPPNHLKGKSKAKSISFGRHGGFKDKDMQVIIGWILRAGVIISMIIVSIGGVLFVYRHGKSTADYHTFNGVPDMVRSAKGIVNNALAFHGQAIIQMGIILLILTPVIRVAFSAVGFLIEKDYLYTGISALVLLIILASMVTGHLG